MDCAPTTPLCCPRLVVVGFKVQPASASGSPTSVLHLPEGGATPRTITASPLAALLESRPRPATLGGGLRPIRTVKPAPSGPAEAPQPSAAAAVATTSTPRAIAARPRSASAAASPAWPVPETVCSRSHGYLARAFPAPEPLRALPAASRAASLADRLPFEMDDL